MEGGSKRGCQVQKLRTKLGIFTLHLSPPKIVVKHTSEVPTVKPRLGEGARTAREASIAEDLARRSAEAQAREAVLRASEAEAMLARLV